MNAAERLERIESKLEEIQRLLTEQADEILDAEGVRQLTGLSPSGLYQKTCCRNGAPPEIPHYKQGKRLYFRRSEIMRWLTRNRVKDRSQIEADTSAYRTRRNGRHGEAP